MKGFTLIEVLISFAVVTVLFGSVVGVFRHFMAQKDIHDTMLKFNHDIQLVEKQLYLDCLRMGPQLHMNSNGDIFIRGEETAQPLPQTIMLYDTDRNTDNGAELLTMDITFLKPFGRREKVQYGFDREKGILYRQIRARKKILVKGLTELHFHMLDRGIVMTGREKRTRREQDFSTAFSFVKGFVRVRWGGFMELK